MEIYKILNNNVIVSKNEHDKEIIAMGKGIAFKKKVGEHIEDELIDKVYTLSDEVSSKFQELAAEIPVEHMKISDDIIKYVKLKLGKKLNDSIYLSLCDHISTAILRHEEGVDVKNVLLWDIKKFYKDEFEIGKHGLEMIKEKLNVQLNEDEAGFIALHIVNAEMDEKLETIYEVTKVMQESMFRSDRRVIQAAGNGINRSRFTVYILQHNTLKAVHEAFFTEFHRSGMVAQSLASSQWLDSCDVHGIIQEGNEHADGVAASAHAGAHLIREHACHLQELVPCLISHDGLEITYHQRKWMGA